MTMHVGHAERVDKYDVKVGESAFPGSLWGCRGLCSWRWVRNCWSPMTWFSLQRSAQPKYVPQREESMRTISRRLRRMYYLRRSRRSCIVLNKIWFEKLKAFQLPSAKCSVLHGSLRWLRRRSSRLEDPMISSRAMIFESRRIRRRCGCGRSWRLTNPSWWSERERDIEIGGERER